MECVYQKNTHGRTKKQNINQTKINNYNSLEKRVHINQLVFTLYVCSLIDQKRNETLDGSIPHFVWVFAWKSHVEWKCLFWNFNFLSHGSHHRFSISSYDECVICGKITDPMINNGALVFDGAKLWSAMTLTVTDWFGRPIWCIKWFSIVMLK